MSMKNKLVAIRTIYPKGWKLGESPDVRKQGESGGDQSGLILAHCPA